MAITTGALIAGAVIAGTAAYTADQERLRQEKAASVQQSLLQQQQAQAGQTSPATVKEIGGMDRMDLMRRRAKSGQASTVKTGALVPPNIGYKSLLG